MHYERKKGVQRPQPHISETIQSRFIRTLDASEAFNSRSLPSLVCYPTQDLLEFRTPFGPCKGRACFRVQKLRITKRASLIHYGCFSISTLGNVLRSLALSTTNIFEHLPRGLEIPGYRGEASSEFVASRTTLVSSFLVQASSHPSFASSVLDKAFSMLGELEKQQKSHQSMT